MNKQFIYLLAFFIIVLFKKKFIQAAFPFFWTETFIKIIQRNRLPGLDFSGLEFLSSYQRNWNKKVCKNSISEWLNWSKQQFCQIAKCQMASFCTIVIFFIQELKFERTKKIFETMCRIVLGGSELFTVTCPKLELKSNWHWGIRLLTLMQNTFRGI